MFQFGPVQDWFLAPAQSLNFDHSLVIKQFMIAHKVSQCPSGTCVCDTLPLQLHIYLIYLFIINYLFNYYQCFSTSPFPPSIISIISIISNPLDGESLEGRASVLNPPDLAGLLCRSCSSFRAGPRVT